MSTKYSLSKISISLILNSYVTDILGHRRLLWIFCCDGNISMVDYLLSMPNIEDPEMEDGTTGFSMALAQSNIKMAKIFLDFHRKYCQVRLLERHRDIKLTRHALLGLSEDSNMRKMLEEVLLAMGENNQESSKKTLPSIQCCQR